MKRLLHALSCIAAAAAALPVIGCRSAESELPSDGRVHHDSPGEFLPPSSAGREPYHVPPADYDADPFRVPPAPLPRTSRIESRPADGSAAVRRTSGAPARPSSARRLGAVRHAGPAREARPLPPRTLPSPGPEWRDIARTDEQSKRDALPVARNPVSLGRPEFLHAESKHASDLVSLANPFGFEPLPTAPAMTDASVGGDMVRASKRVASKESRVDPWSLPIFDDGDAAIAD